MGEEIVLVLDVWVEEVGHTVVDWLGSGDMEVDSLLVDDLVVGDDLVVVDDLVEVDWREVEMEEVVLEKVDLVEFFCEKVDLPVVKDLM